MRIRLLLIASLLIQASRIFAQDNYVDSLRQSVRGYESDTESFRSYIDLGKYYYYNLGSVESAIMAVEDAETVGRKNQVPQYVAQATYWKAYFVFGVSATASRPVFALKKRTLDAIAILDAGLSYARQYKLKDAECDLLVLQSRILVAKRDSALLLLEEARRIAAANGLFQQEGAALAFEGMLYTSSNPDTARRLISSALSLLRKAGNRDAEILVLRQIARAWARGHQTDTAIYYVRQALQITRDYKLVNGELFILPDFIKSQSPYFVRDSLENNYLRIRQLCRQYQRDSLAMMQLYVQTTQDIGNYVAALQTGLQSLHVAEARKDTFSIQSALYALGLSYEYSFDYARAIDYFKKALPLAKQNAFGHIFTLDDLARCYVNLHDYDSARHYAAASYLAAKDFYGGEAFIFGGVLNDLGTIYFEMGEDSLALNYLRRSYADFTTNNIQNKNFALTTGALAKYFARHGQADSVRHFASLALKTSQEGGFLENITESSALMAQYYLGKRQMDSAYYYQDIGFNAYKKLYSSESSREFQNLAHAEQQRDEEIAMARKLAADKYANNLKLYGLMAALLLAVIVGLITFRNNQQRQKSYELLKTQKQEIDAQKSKLEASLDELRNTQQQLIQSEKMASLGELTAGIAHEIQNPLNFVNNFSEINKELLDEMTQAAARGDVEEVKAIATDIRENSEKINHHGKRADAIVKGMLEHSRANSGQKEPTNINSLCDEFLRLAYHGLRAKDKSFNAKFETHFDPSLPPVLAVSQDLGRVLLNLYNNAFYAVNEKAKQGVPGYMPTVIVTTKNLDGKVQIEVCDNGNGIPQAIVTKIFQPFFTTKPAGQGTGLGLSLSYDIIAKGHEGEINAETKEGGGTRFIIVLSTMPK